MTRPYQGGTTETSNLDRILELMPNHQLSRLTPPPDMSTRTDIAGGLLLPREQPQESKPWYDFSNLPVWEGTLPGGPQDAAYQISELSKDVAPGIGQVRSAQRSAAETAKAKGLLAEGKYLEAIPPSLWAGVEGLDVALSALPLAGPLLSAPLDIARAGRRLMTPKITGRSFEGRVGERDHLTRRETGTVDINSISHLEGLDTRGKIQKRGEHRNRQGKDWEDFKVDIKKNGIKEPIFITKDYNQKAIISEGNHRLDAAIEVGLKDVPVEINYFGKAEDQGSAFLTTLPKLPILPKQQASLTTPKLTKPQAIINHGVRNLPTLRKAINKARKEGHLINDHSKGANGQFVGGPRGVKSKAQIEKMRKEFDAQVAGGVLGADWYDRVRTMIKGVSGGSRKAEDRLSEALALWSAQAQPRPNLNWSFEALNNYAATKGITFPEKIKTTAQARKFLEGMLSGEQIKLGKKTGVYKQSLDPNVETPITGTNDIWHGRAFGYKNNDGTPFSRGFTPQEHVFLDSETVLAVDRANKAKLGGRTNWTAAEIQAAAWVYAKGKSQFAKYPNKFNGNLNEAIEWAKQTYPDELNRQLAFGTREYIPGVRTGHLQKVTKSDPATRKEFSEEISGTLGTDIDVITEAAGLYSPGVRPATGVFTSKTTGQLETNPAQVNQVIIDLVNDEGGRTISDVSQSFLNAVEGIQGYTNMQNGSAWHKFFPYQKGGGVKSSVSNSIQIQTGAPLDEARMRVLAGWAEERGLLISDNGKSVVLWPDEWGSKPALSSAGEVVVPAEGLPDGPKMRRLLEGKKRTKTREAVGGWQEELADILQVDTSEIERGRVISGYVDYEGMNKISNSSSKNQGRGLRTDTVLKLLDDPNISAIEESIDSSPEFRQLIFDNIARATDWSKKMKSPLRQDHMRALEILAKEGFKGLRKAFKNGAVLPAVALPIFGAGFQVHQEQQGATGA